MRSLAVIVLGGCLTRPSPVGQQPDGQALPTDQRDVAPACQSTTPVDLFMSGTCGTGTFGGGNGSAMASSGQLELEGTSMLTPVTCSWGTLLGTGVAVSVAMPTFPADSYLQVATSTHITQLIVEPANAEGLWLVETWLDGDSENTIDSAEPPTEIRLSVSGTALRTTFQTASGPLGGFSIYAGDVTVPVQVSLGATGDGMTPAEFSQFVVCPTAE